nr:hypothetical protein [Tanacetum cinerariifolium]
ALIDEKKVVVKEDVIRRDLHLNDADKVECLLNEEIFAELVRMGYERPHSKLTFYKAFFSVQWKFLIHTLIQCLSRKFNFSKYLFNSMVRNVDSPSKFLMYLCFQQVVMDNQVDDQTFYSTRYTSLVLTQKVAELEQDKHTKVLEILKLKKRVKKLEKKKRLKHLGFKMLRNVGTSQKVESSTDTVVGAQEDASKQGGR